MATKLAFDEERRLIRIGKTLEYTPKRENKGSSGVATEKGEEVWVNFYQTKLRSGGTRYQGYAYVVRDNKLDKITFNHIDFSTLAREVIEEGERSSGKSNYVVGQSNLAENVRPLWRARKWVAGEAKDARAARAGTVNPQLGRRRNLDKPKPISKKQLANNNMTISREDAKELIREFNKKQPFADGSYERLRAAIQVVEGIEQQPPVVLLREAKDWSLAAAGRALKYAKYRKWRSQQNVMEKDARKSAKQDARKTWLELVDEDDFKPEDLTAEDWRDIWATEYRIQTGRDVDEDS